MPSFAEQFDRLEDCSLDQAIHYLEEIKTALFYQSKTSQKEAGILTEELYASLLLDLSHKQEDCLRLTLLAIRHVSALKQTTDSMVDQESKIKLMGRKLREYEGLFDDLQNDLKAREKTIEELEETLQDRDRLISASSAEIGDLKTDLKELNKELKTRSESVDRQKGLISQSEFTQMTHYLDVQTEKCRHLEDLLESAERKIAETSKNSVSEKVASEKLKQALTLSKAQNAKLRSDYDESILRLMESERKTKDLDHEILKQKTQIQTLIKEQSRERRQSGIFDIRSMRTGSIEEDNAGESLGGFIMEEEIGAFSKGSELQIWTGDGIHIGNKEGKRKAELGICIREGVVIKPAEKKLGEMQLQVISLSISPSLPLPDLHSFPDDEARRERRISSSRCSTPIIHKCVKTDIGIQANVERKRAMILKRFKQAEIIPKNNGGKGRNFGMILKTMNIAKIAPIPRVKTRTIETQVRVRPILNISVFSQEQILHVAKSPPILCLWHSEAVNIGRWSVFEILTYSTEEDVQSQLSTPRAHNRPPRPVVRQDPTEEFFTLVRTIYRLFRLLS